MHARHFLVFFRAEHNVGAYKQAASIPPAERLRSAQKICDSLVLLINPKGHVTTCVDTQLERFLKFRV